MTGGGVDSHWNHMKTVSKPGAGKWHRPVRGLVAADPYRDCDAAELFGRDLSQRAFAARWLTESLAQDEDDSE